MACFDFLADLPYYQDEPASVLRMNRRYEMLIAPFADEIKGACVLDLGAHDGRWSYAFAHAGARHVLGVEAREEMISLFDDYPDPDLRARVDLRQGDMFEEIEAELASGSRYDIVAAFGVYYHIMDHFRLLRLMMALRPKMILIDSEFVIRGGPVIQMMRERTDKVLNAAPQIEGQHVAVKGIPSHKAMETMTDVLGWRCEWLDWTQLPKDKRRGVRDYFRTEEMRRGSCVLRPGA